LIPSKPEKLWRILKSAATVICLQIRQFRPEFCPFFPREARIEPYIGGMPLLTIHHKTEYRYTKPVAFGEHRVMLRPRDGHDLRVLDGKLEIVPQPSSLRWIHDVFGNTVAVANFDARADRLVFDSMITVEHSPHDDLALTPDDDAWHYPFAYDEEELPDLAQSITPQYADPDRLLETWALGFLSPSGRTVTIALLTGMTHAVRADFTYRRRYEHGTQHPLDTLATRSGTCRDFALLMMEALRRLGIAARFVSGYLFIPGNSGHLGGGSTHAWVQAYIPGAGWVEFDPTNGIVGNRDLVRVAVARDPHQAIPLHGSYYGRADEHLGMRVSIRVLSSEEGDGHHVQSVRAQDNVEPIAPARLEKGNPIQVKRG